MSPAVAAAFVGVYGLSAVVFASLLLVDKVHDWRQRRRVVARRPVPVDSFPFASEQEQAALYARFWEVVDPLRAANAPVVPGDGGAPRWTL